MADFFVELTAEERRLFGELMAMRDADGHLLKTADEVATDLIKRFVTLSGTLEKSVADRLGGQPSYGRRDVLLDLLRAVTGPHPLPQAWIEAKLNDGLDMTFYRAKRKRDDERSVGSAGGFLPRMVAQYRDGVNRVRVSPAGNAALYSEAAMMTTAMGYHDLQRAVCAKQALGPAWVVGLAVHPLPPKTRRQMDAMADNPAYVEALGQAVAEVTARFATPDLAERTTDDVKHSLPPGADIETFFIGHEERQLADTIDALVAATEQTASKCRNADVVVDLTGSEEAQRASVRIAKVQNIYLNGYVDFPDDMGWYGARMATGDLFARRSLLDLQNSAYLAKLFAPLAMTNTTNVYAPPSARQLLEWGFHIVPPTPSQSGGTVSAMVTGGTSANSAARRHAIVTLGADATPLIGSTATCNSVPTGQQGPEAELQHQRQHDQSGHLLTGRSQDCRDHWLGSVGRRRSPFCCPALFVLARDRRRGLCPSITAA